MLMPYQQGSEKNSVEDMMPRAKLLISERKFCYANWGKCITLSQQNFWENQILTVNTNYCSLKTFFTSEYIYLKPFLLSL